MPLIPGSTKPDAAPVASTRYLPAGAAGNVGFLPHPVGLGVVAGLRPLELFCPLEVSISGRAQARRDFVDGHINSGGIVQLRRIGPSTRALAAAPIRMAICCALGVAPIRKPVLRSCEVVPPFDAAIQTIPPTESAVTNAVPPVRRHRKMRHVSSSVATVIPEIGLDDEPISPVSRDETVTKRKPNRTMSIAPRIFM